MPSTGNQSVWCMQNYALLFRDLSNGYVASPQGKYTTHPIQTPYPHIPLTCSTTSNFLQEECQGHLLKVGLAYTNKAKAFFYERNFLQTLRYAELALTKLMRLIDRPLAVISLLDEALSYKFNALNMNIMSRLKDRGA